MRVPTTIRAALATASVSALAVPAAAHVGGLSNAVTAGGVPSWLTVLTGGVVIGASFLFTSLLTDREAIRRVNALGVRLPTPAAVRTAVRGVVQSASLALLLVVMVIGLVGPADPLRNLAILVVWAGWWAGYTMSVYLVGNSWPLLNPWRPLVGLVDRTTDLVGRYDYPERLGAWPSVVGLLALVWVEVVTPVAEDPPFLVALIAVYSVVTVAGAVAVGPETWFTVADPIARVFRLYGWMAPIQLTDDGLEFRLPTAALTERRLPERGGETAFVIALLWVTTYDGLVATPGWEWAIAPLVEAGVPALLVYFVAILVGFGLFLLVYRVASRRSRAKADTYVEASFLEHFFAPSLLPIAAGYHLAHFLGYFLTLLPTLGATVLAPLTGVADPQVLVLPPAFGIVQLLFVLLGHVLAIWVAHSASFDLFPGILTPLRSQYSYVVVMILYTITSMWIVVQPFTAPPFV